MGKKFSFKNLPAAARRAAFAHMHQAGEHVKKAHEYVKGHGQTARSVGAALRDAGTSAIRNAPVEALAAKGVDKLFGGAESFLHKKVSHSLGRLEEIGAAKMGAAQGFAAAHAAKHARRLHRKFLPQPSSASDLKRLSERTAEVTGSVPDLSSLASRRTLRTGYLDKKVDVAARGVLKKLLDAGKLPEAAMGLIDPKILVEEARKHGIKDEQMLVRLHQRAHHFMRHGTGRSI